MPDATPTTTPPVAPAPVPTPPAAPVPTPPAGATPPADPAPVSGATKPDGVTDAEWAALGDPGKAAIVRERHAVAEAQRLLVAEQAKVKAFEDASKTQEQKDTESRAAERLTSAQNAAKALRYEVAAEKGIPLTAAPRLVGATREEIVADADRFLADFPNLRVSATRVPAPDPGQGPRPNGPQSEDDTLYESIYGPTPTRK